MAHAAKRAEAPFGADETDTTESLLRALIQQERENSQKLRDLAARVRREAVRGNEMLVEVGLRPVDLG